MLHQMPGWLRRLLRHRRGISAVEFAFIAPVLAVILFAMVDVGGAAFQYIELVQALSAGSAYAMNHSSDTSGIKAAVTAALPSGWTNVTVGAPLYFCMNSANSCSSPPASSSPIPASTCCPNGNCASSASSGQAIYLTASRPNSSIILSSIGTKLNVCEIARFQ
jgi:Flp pilus assembly protein TadG